MTVRQAIDALVADEVLERVVGVGTFVARPKMDLQIKLTSYSEEMHRRGMVPGCPCADLRTGAGLPPGGAGAAD